MKKFFIILSVLIVATVMEGCLNLSSIIPISNVSPIIISEPIITATEDQLYSYQVEASDPNGDILTYSSIIKPEGMSIDSESGLISWTPANNQVGIHQVIIEISDGKLSTTQSFEIEVSNVNNPPQILSYSPNSLNVVVNEGESIKFEVQAYDIDLNTTLSYQWFLNGKLVLDSTVSGDGSKSSWIYSASYGDYSQKIVKILISDGELENSIQWNIIINDITPPAQPTLDTVLSPTNVSPQTLSGTKESNTSIWINGVEVIPVNSNTIWSYDFELTEGENSISIISRDSAGNESNEINTTIVLDTTAPAIPSLETVTSPTNISIQILLGTKEVNSSIFINGTEVISLNSSTDWSYSYNLSEGANNISITSRDAVGNESLSVSATIILDTINPAVPTLDTVTSPTNVSPQTLSGNKETNSSIWINGTEVISINSDIAWSYNFDLFEGNNSILITSRDAFDNESTAVITDIVLDTIAPETPTLNAVTSPTNISPQILSGTKETNTSIWLNGVEVVPLNSSTNWSYSYNLSEGANDISIASRDAAGNESSAVLTTIEYDLNIYVDIGNTSGIEDGTQAHPFNSITEGIEAVTSGKSVVVSAGTYNEQLIINIGITLQGAGKESTFIIGLGYTGNLITVTADDVTISGFTIDGKSGTDVGIYSDLSSSIEILENLIQSHQDSGILYHRTSDDYPSGIYVYNNEICQNSLNGIKVTGAGSGIIEGNIIRNNDCGINATTDTSIEVKMNNIYNNYDSGIFCRNNSSLLIWSNEITSNGYGIRVGEQYSDTTNPDIGGGDRGGIGMNNITGNIIHGVSNVTDHNIFAKYNWWGDAVGPKYPGNPNNTTVSSDWAYWSEAGGDIIFNPHLTAEP